MLMKTQSAIKWAGYITSLLVLIFSFFISYNETQEIFSSLSIAILASLMVWGTFIIMGWLWTVLK